MAIQDEHTAPRNKGFAAMNAELQRQIASKGGKAAHAHGRAHEFTAEEARAAGRKGGESISKNREHMADIGRRGGLARSRAVAARGGASAGDPVESSVAEE
jgi:general stress protein YciG